MVKQVDSGFMVNNELKAGIVMPISSFKFEGNIITRKLIDCAKFDFIYPEVENFISASEWNGGIESPAELSWFLADEKCRDEDVMMAIDLKEVASRVLRENFTFAKFIDLLIIAVTNPRRQESINIVSLGTCLEVDGKKAYPFLGGSEDAFRVLGVIFQEDITWGGKYAFLVKPIFK